MMQNIRQLEKTARLLDPSPAQRERLIQHVIAYANDYLDGISDAATYEVPADNGRALYESPIAEDGIDIEEALVLVREQIRR